MFVYQSANAKSAKARLSLFLFSLRFHWLIRQRTLVAQETLSGRDLVADEHRQAVKSSISKRRNIEKLKSASSLRADKVNEALEDLDEVRHRVFSEFVE